MTFLSCRLHPPNCYRSEPSHGVFAVAEHNETGSGNDSEKQSVAWLLGVNAHKNSSLILLKPGEQHTLRLSFTPFSAVRSSSVIFIR